MIAMHHPAFRIGRPFSDARPFRNADKFAALVARYPNVSLIVAGHVHCTLQARIGNAVAIAAPSTAYQFLMDRREDASISLIDRAAGILRARLKRGARLYVAMRAGRRFYRRQADVCGEDGVAGMERSHPG